jgi:uncharacterized protein (TIGR03083 family)
MKGERRLVAGKKETATQLIEQTYQELDKILESFSEDELARASSNEGWTGKDVLAHLTTIEERTRGQINAAIKGLDWNPAEAIDDYNARQVAARRGQSFQQLRADLVKEHEQTLGLLKNATEADFDKEFTHPRRGRITLAQLCEQSVNHVRTHSSEIAAVRGS